MSALEIPAVAYHRDEVANVPTLSASIATLLCTSSPAHAAAAHPKLNPEYERPDDGDKFDVGTIVHSLLLQGDDTADVMPYPDWRTAAAREHRDASRAAGRIPLLTKDYDRVRRMIDAVRNQLALRDPVPFTEGKPEVTLVWHDEGVMCRGRLDWLTDDRQRVFDLKSTARSASPFKWGKTIYDTGADIQMAAYRRAVQALYGTAPEYRWVVCETQPPYAVTVFRPGAELIAFAEDRWAFAREMWAGCLERNEWPGYGHAEVTVEVPGYEMARWMEREAA